MMRDNKVIDFIAKHAMELKQAVETAQEFFDRKVWVISTDATPGDKKKRFFQLSQLLMAICDTAVWLRPRDCFPEDVDSALLVIAEMGVTGSACLHRSAELWIHHGERLLSVGDIHPTDPRCWTKPPTCPLHDLGGTIARADAFSQTFRELRDLARFILDIPPIPEEVEATEKVRQSRTDR